MIFIWDFKNISFIQKNEFYQFEYKFSHNHDDYEDVQREILELKPQNLKINHDAFKVNNYEFFFENIHSFFEFYWT